jgi:hypothetical protein
MLISLQVVVAYCVEIGGTLILAIALWAFYRFGNRESWLYRETERPLIQGMSTFFDSSVFFCIAIQVASSVVLAKRDFVISSAGFGETPRRISKRGSRRSDTPSVCFT